jgi:hypothetical protein
MYVSGDAIFANLVSIVLISMHVSKSIECCGKISFTSSAVLKLLYPMGGMHIYPD